jgi:hypothetical protein
VISYRVFTAEPTSPDKYHHDSQQKSRAETPVLSIALFVEICGVSKHNDLKSVDRNIVPVQVRPRAPFNYLKAG